MKLLGAKKISIILLILGGLSILGAVFAKPPKMKMTTDIPADITIPDKVKTSLGTLEFFDGLPKKETVAKIYDNLDLLHAVDVFLNAMPGASLYAMREGLRSQGAGNDTLLVTENLMDSRSLFLTANTESIYVSTWLDLKDGPLVVECPPNVLGFVDDFWFHYVIDMGNAGPDKGAGGKYLFLPPGYSGEIPDGYFVARPRTFGNWLLIRGFLVNADPKPSVGMIKKMLRIYPLAQADNPPPTKFIDGTGKSFNTIHASNAKFYEEVNAVVQEEPVDALDPELLGQLAAIGIQKGKPFAPDARMRKILDDAAAIGSATARALAFSPRNKEYFYYPGSYWFMPFPGGSYEFLDNGARTLNARTFFFFTATGITPAMAIKMAGVGSQYAASAMDAQGNYLEGTKNYKLRLPVNVPVKNFWSIVVYDPQTRSMLQTDNPFPSLNSQKGVKQNADGSTDIYFGPKAPKGKESNWIQTVPGKGWFVILRLYGPLDSWFDKSWRPGEIELIK